jgi:ribosomal protein S18 acetylase RimI-like enzyme
MAEIRRTAQADADVLRTIRLAALQADPTVFGAAYDDVVEYGPEVWAERATGGDDLANFLAWHDGEAVGMVAGVESDPGLGRVELVSMWTAPEARGLGVGQQLVEEVLQWAAQRGTPEARLWVTTGNDAALRLYQRCGFELTEEVGVAASDPCREELRMVRRPPIDTIGSN